MSTFRMSGRPTVGACEGHVLRVLRTATFRGPVIRLARLAGFSEASTWLAIAGLAARGMIVAKRVDSNVECSITERGRRGV